MTRRRFVAGHAATTMRASSRRPNVLFILTDDQSYSTLSLTGSRVIKTPNIDRIGREGALFKNFFVTTSLCAPSRASFLTGLYAHSHRILTLREKWNQSLQTWPAALQAAGYKTAYVGKFHMDHDDRVQPGFDYWAAQVSQGEYWNPRKNVNGQFVELRGYDTTIVTDQVLQFMDDRDRRRPFCAIAAYKAPHAPFTPAPGHEKFLGDLDFPAHPDFGKVDPGKPKRLQSPQKPTEATGGSVWPLERFAERERNYYRSLMGVEESVGRLLRRLDDHELTSNTIVLYTSDNGFFHGEHGLQTKMEAYEESIRVPALFRYPDGVKAGLECDAMVANVDVAATIAEYCGVQLARRTQGHSWRRALSGDTRSRRSEFLYEYFGMDAEATPLRPAVKALRTERQKLIVNSHPADVDELYDLEKDPREMNNLALDKSYAGRVKNLRERMVQTMRELGDPAADLIARGVGK